MNVGQFHGNQTQEMKHNIYIGYGYHMRLLKIGRINREAVHGTLNTKGLNYCEEESHLYVCPET